MDQARGRRPWRLLCKYIIPSTVQGSLVPTYKEALYTTCLLYMAPGTHGDLQSTMPHCHQNTQSRDRVAVRHQLAPENLDCNQANGEVPPTAPH